MDGFGFCGWSIAFLLGLGHCKFGTVVFKSFGGHAFIPLGINIRSGLAGSFGAWELTVLDGVGAGDRQKPCDGRGRRGFLGTSQGKDLSEGEPRTC